MVMQVEIPGASIALPSLPDETLFSWCSRYHRLAANGQDRTTCLQLFGHPRIGAAHDFPARVDLFAARSQAALGNSAQIIRDRTLLPFYLPFKPQQVCHQAVTALRGEGIGHLKFRLGLLTSGLGAAHPLKACPLCIESDLTSLGWTYWHRSHQWPGVWLCPEHHVPLRISPMKLGQVARFSWVLPGRALCGPVAGLEAACGELAHHGWLLKLARSSCELPTCTAASLIDPIKIGGAFRWRLAQMGMSHDGGRIRWREVDSRLGQLATHLCCVPGLNQQADPELLRTQLVRLLSGRSLTHPLRYLVWIATWFDSLEDFLKEYSMAGVAMDKGMGDPNLTHKGDLTEAPDPNREQVLALVQQGKISLTAATRRLGVSYVTMTAWACQNQVVAPRRPKKLDDRLWSQAVELLQTGRDKEEVARTCQVSITSVTRILRTVPGLQDEWHRMRYELRRTVARQAWKQVSRLHAYLTIKALRQLEPAAYAWLYRNDRNWLKASLEHVARAPSENHSATRMLRADARMAQALKRVALASTPRPAAVTWGGLKRTLPALNKAFRYPQRWPLTVRTLTAILDSRDCGHPLLDQAWT